MRKLFAAAVLALAAAPAAAATCPGPAETAKLSVMTDWLPWGSQGPFYAAKLAGAYTAEGLDVDILSPANPADPIKLAARSRVSFSMTYVPDVLLARETGIPVVSVAALLRVLSSGLLFTEESGITSPADLKGKTLGVSPKADAQAYVRTVLASAKLTPADVKIVDPGFAYIPMLVEKKIDAAHGLTYVGTIQANPLLERQGRKPVKALRYAEFGVPNYYFMVLVANEDWLAKNPNATCRFLAGTEAGIKQWLASPDAALGALGRNQVFSAQQHRELWQATGGHWLGADGKPLVQDADTWRRAQDWALDQKLITLASEPDAYFTNKLLPK